MGFSATLVASELEKLQKYEELKVRNKKKLVFTDFNEKKNFY